MGKLEKNALLFTFGNIFTNAAGFLLLPFYTHLISPEEYGVINILLIISSFLTVTFSLTIHGGISRFYFDCKKDTDVISLYTDVLKFSLLISGSLYVVLFLIVDSDSLFLIKKKYFYIVFIISWLGVFVNNTSSINDGQARSKKNYSFTMITSFIGLLLNILLSNHKMKEMWLIWEKRVLFLFYLPLYSPHLNIGETLWRILKGKLIRVQDYVSTDALFYATNSILTPVGKSLFITHTPIRLFNFVYLLI